MKPKSIKNEDGVAIATLYGSLKAKVHCRAIEMGGDTITALSKEDPTVIIKCSLEYLDIQNDIITETNNFELCSDLTIKTKASNIPTTDWASDEFKTWFVDKCVG